MSAEASIETFHFGPLVSTGVPFHLGGISAAPNCIFNTNSFYIGIIHTLKLISCPMLYKPPWYPLTDQNLFLFSYYTQFETDIVLVAFKCHYISHCLPANPKQIRM